MVDIDQALDVLGFELVAVRNNVPDPPEVLLQAHIKHEETDSIWTTQLRFSRAQAQVMIALLRHLTEKEGLDWPK